MILAQDLRNQLAFALDAEGSDHYRDDLDYIPAINAASKWATNLVSFAYGQNKISEEFFRDISYSGVFKTNNNSRVSLASFPSEVWTILAIYIDPTLETISNTPTPTPDIHRSYYLSEYVHVYSNLDCKRLSIEEWAKNRENPFEAGYGGDQICESLRRYAYLSPINYRPSSSELQYSQELEIRPRLVNKNVTVFWAKRPTPITSLSQNVDFPSSMFQILFDKALNYIAYKQGDQTNLYSVSSADIQQLITSM
jgi:hypothetical protein